MRAARDFRRLRIRGWKSLHEKALVGHDLTDIMSRYGAPTHGVINPKRRLSLSGQDWSGGCALKVVQRLRKTAHELDAGLSGRQLAAADVSH